MLAVIVTYLGHAMRRRKGETNYVCEHCGCQYASLHEPTEWCEAALNAWAKHLSR